MTIGSSTFTRDSSLFLRDLLVSKLSDPITRSGDEKYIMTSYPSRPVRYPIITISCDNIGATARAGTASEGLRVPLSFEVRVWARNAKERDVLTDSVINTLRTEQTTTGSGSIPNQLFNFRISSAVNVDEPGEAGIKSRVITANYEVYADS